MSDYPEYAGFTYGQAGIEAMKLCGDIKHSGLTDDKRDRLIALFSFMRSVDA